MRRIEKLSMLAAVMLLAGTPYLSLHAVVIGSNTAVSREAVAKFPSDDTNNELRGFALFENGFILEDSNTTCIWNDVFSASSEIRCNGGTLALYKDFQLDSQGVLSTILTVSGNNHFFELAASGDNRALGEVQVMILKDNIDAGGTVYSIDWSYDNQYIAIADSIDNSELKVYSFDGSTLTYLTSANLDALPGYAVRWAPGSYRLAAGSDVSNKFQLLSFTPPTTLTKGGSVNPGHAVRAVSWYPDGSYLAAATGSLDTDAIVVYPVTVITLGTPIVATTTNNVVASDNSLSWNSTGEYIALGLQQNAAEAELQVFSFNGTTLTINASEDFGLEVSGLDWSHTNSLLLVGLSGGTQNLRLYEHDGGAGTLTELTSARVDLTESVLSADWSPDGQYIAVGLANADIGLRIYEFDATTTTLTLVRELDSFDNVYGFRWSPDQQYIAKGTDGQDLSVYDPFGFNQSIFIDCTINLLSDLSFLRDTIFRGTCRLIGNGHTITIPTDGGFSVDVNSSLLFDNCKINGQGGYVRFLDSTSTYSLDNVEISLSEDFTFTQGKIDVVGDVIMSGGVSFNYMSPQQSTIYSGATLYFDEGMTFSYAPISADRDLLRLEDELSVFHLYNTTLASTSTGLTLTKGELVIGGTCPVRSSASNADEGIFFGDGISSDNNIRVDILAGSGLDVQSGYLCCKSVS